MPVPGVWGPIVWNILHQLSIQQEIPQQFQKDKILQYKWLIEHIESIIPCEECRKHVQQYRRSHPTYMNNPKEWMWEFHNAVNQRLGKEPFPFESLEKKGSIRDFWKPYPYLLQESLLIGHLRG